MVDVRGLIPLLHEGDQLQLDRKILFPQGWFRMHRRLGNLQISQDINVLLDSDKMSHRLLAEFLIDYEAGALDAWNYQYLILNLCGRCIEALKPAAGVRSFLVSWGRREPITLPVSHPYRWNKVEKQWYISNGSGAAELSYNRLMCSMFCGKYPVSLGSMMPVTGKVEVNVPVVTPKTFGKQGGKIQRTGIV